MTDDYILSKSAQWRRDEVKWIIDDEIGRQRWDVKVALMSHTPMTKEAARSLEKEIKDLERAFDKIQRSLAQKKKKPSSLVSGVVSIEYDNASEANDDLLKGLKKVRSHG